MPTTLINVSNRLPVTVGEDNAVTKSSGGLVAALAGLPAGEYDARWIGWPGGEIAADRQEAVARTLQDEHGCTPVFLSAEEEKAFYEGFANSSVWPLLHYMPNYLRYETAWWEAYRQINQRFAETVLEHAGEGDLVWVHDYQLLLLPALLRAARPSLRIGFFLHTPFPAFEVYRCHPRGRELVQGMLGADVLGFHTFGYLRHFRSAAQRLLGVGAGITSLQGEDGHHAELGVYPIGIHAAKFDETLDDPDHARRQQKFRATFQGKRLVLSVERMDYTKGILHRLEAVDCFLAGREERDDIKFIFVSVPSREGVEEYQDLRADVEARVGRLNGKYATLHNSPIHFVHDSVDFADLCALYAVADVCLVTPLVDGMNLVAKEFLACQRTPTGPLILSEFAGAAEELSQALIVNPYDAPAVAATIQRALAMPAAETRARNGAMRERVMRLDAGQWAKSFLDDLSKVGRSGQSLPEQATGPAEAPALSVLSEKLARAAKDGTPVRWFLDYDGTLREFTDDPAAARPDAELLSLLEAVANQPGWELTLVSGRTPADLDAFFPDARFGLVAEHGASRRLPGASSWEELDGGADYRWKDDVRRIFQLYADTVPGSRVEEKRTSLVWHYRRADDAETARRKACQLTEELGAMVGDAPVLIRPGHRIVEAVSAQISKGWTVRQALRGREKGIVVCAGDDRTDESMFEIDYAATGDFVTIKVGEEPTLAEYRADNPTRFRAFLREARS